MALVQFNPYIFFNGNCEEAMKFYQSIFGGELDLKPYEDMPNSEHQMGGKIMHAALTGDITFMAADSPDPKDTSGRRITLSLGGDDETKLTEYFNKLSGGGTITSPLKKEFWGDTFGMLTDKYDVDWMVNISGAKAMGA